MININIFDLNDLAETLRVGFLQTTLDYEKAWPTAAAGAPPPEPVMTASEAHRAQIEIQRGIHWLTSAAQRPEIIVLPELAVARPHLNSIERISRESGALVLAGFDYRRSFHAKSGGGQVRNEVALFVPDSWPSGKACRRARPIWIGKTYPSDQERKKLADCGWQFVADPTLWLFDSGRYGRFGVCVCYDFLDVARPVLYRRQIHHLFVLAYNRDTNSFAHNAEALSRTLFCNVIVCNGGHFGGSHVITPYYNPWRRPSFRLDGPRLGAAQIVDVPVAPIDRAWRDARRASEKTGEDRLKGLPPGFSDEHDLHLRNKTLPDFLVTND